MPRYVCAVLLASALLRLPPAVADPVCFYVGTTGTLLGEQVLANPCVGYAGDVRCVLTEPGVTLVGLVLVICRPVA